MRAASSIGRYPIRQTCFRDSIGLRGYSNGSRGKRRRQQASEEKDVGERERSYNAAKHANAGNEPSLFEQLFPDQRETPAKSPQHESNIPRLPLEKVHPDRKVSPDWVPRRRAAELHWSNLSQRRRQEMAAQSARPSVLVLRNASKNLVEEDFTRLIPKGRHMDGGWTLEQGDILLVIPGRDLSTLAQTGFYYLLFSSALSAFTYQGHATRIHRMVAAHTPSSILSPIPPPPGYLIEGMDAYAAMELFTLVPPTQSLELRQLKPPLSPSVEAIVRDGGYAALLQRKDRMPFEARLTLEGPQLHLSGVRHVLVESARDRALGWSGGDDLAPRLTLWEPPGSRDMPVFVSGVPDDEGVAQVQDPVRTNRALDSLPDVLPPPTPSKDQQKRRTAPLVYIVGFHTQRALQSFVMYWHRRPMEWRGSQYAVNEEFDLPPIANVEVLW